MRITSFGAAREVTGSCHRIEVGGLTLLVDCGLIQGDRDADERNRAPFPFEPSDVDYVLLTHGHLDHCGRLPLLAKRGFRGKILATEGTRDVAELILLDSAHLQTEDAARRRRRARRTGGSADPPLHTVQDVTELMERFAVPVRYNRPLELATKMSITFRDAGHVLGSSFVRIDARGEGRSVVFSGDLGQHVVADPAPLEGCDLVVSESTYGDRNHRTVEASVDEFGAIVEEALRRGGNVVIPTFALERAQDVLFHLGELIARGVVQRAPVFLDSPLAINITRLYRRHHEILDPLLRARFDAGDDPFHFDGVEFTRTARESQEINDLRGVIILAGSGMCQGGRVMHHLRHNLGRPESAVVIVGYQARGTRGRRLVDGAEAVRIHGRDLAVRASIHTVGGFSAHADQNGLLGWLAPCRGKRALLVHGEDEALEALSERLSEALSIRAEIAERGRPLQI
ncbi:MAG: MBL fold metallo-hydrolase [Candidatus Bipolaricaulota bacterium]|nr:MAG: MBL fold metallo-hydrolase [Candidatus Bipolaricaulota bacterium]